MNKVQVLLRSANPDTTRCLLHFGKKNKMYTKSAHLAVIGELDFNDVLLETSVHYSIVKALTMELSKFGYSKKYRKLGF